MPLHPTIEAFLASLPAHDDDVPVDPVALRAAEEAHVTAPDDRTPVMHRVEDTVASTANGDVPVRVYSPADAAASPVIVYFHGGAFFLGSLDTHDHVARSLAETAGAIVVSVDYRLAPEHAFPAAIDDALAAVTWIVDHGAQLGWDQETLALAGDSAGGTLVAAVSALAHDEGFERITHQVMYYPALDWDFDIDRYPSLRENAVGYGLETAGIEPYNRFYLDSGADPLDPRVSPIKRTDLTGLPPALILTGEYDPMRDEGEAYGARLAAAGVPVEVTRYRGAGHGFVQHFGWIPEYRRAYEQTADFLRGTR